MTKFKILSEYSGEVTFRNSNIIKVNLTKLYLNLVDSPESDVFFDSAYKATSQERARSQSITIKRLDIDKAIFSFTDTVIPRRSISL